MRWVTEIADRRDRKLSSKIILFPGQEIAAKANVAIDPRMSFGRPVLDGLGVRTTILAERFMAGEDINDLARNYEVPLEAIQNAIRCEQRLAA